MNASDFPMLQSKACYVVNASEIGGKVGGKSESLSRPKGWSTVQLTGENFAWGI